MTDFAPHSPPRIRIVVCSHAHERMKYVRATRAKGCGFQGEYGEAGQAPEDPTTRSSVLTFGPRNGIHDRLNTYYQRFKLESQVPCLESRVPSRIYVDYR